MLNNFGNRQTPLDLNGPILSFTQQPTGVTICAGLAATFTGIATVSFPLQDPVNPATNTGFVTYRWYDQNGPLFDDPPIGGGSGLTISGAGTTTLNLYNNRTPRSIYLVADYVPSAYGLTGVAVTVGSARSTGNANNEIFASNVVSLDVYPYIVLTSQPSPKTVPPGQNATFSVDAYATDGSPLSYQWQINGVNITDSTTSVQQNNFVDAKLTIYEISPSTGQRSGASVVVDLTSSSGVKFIGRNGIGIGWPDAEIVCDKNIEVRVTAVGASGGRSLERDIGGGSGGTAVGRLKLNAGSVYRVIVGRSGSYGSGGSSGYLSRTVGTGGIGGAGLNRSGPPPTTNVLTGQPTGGSLAEVGGGGGGLSGVFLVTSPYAFNPTGLFPIMIAGGGGGAGNNSAGGGGGGTTGGAGFGPNAGQGGTQTAGGAGGSGITFNGSKGGLQPSPPLIQFFPAEGIGGISYAMNGGNGIGGGGAGFWGGGGGGAHNECCDDGGGGGGSGYLDPNFITSGALTTGIRGGGGGANIPGQQRIDPDDGSVTIEVVANTTPVSTGIQGSNTKTLSISSNTPGVNQIRCIISHPTACNSPIVSESVDFVIVSPRQILNFELISQSGPSATLYEWNLFNNPLTIGVDIPRGLTSFYASEKDIVVLMELHGRSGSSYGNNRGGNGGYAVIQFVMKKNEEYVLAGGEGCGVWLYRKSSLIASVGEGGNASSNGRGGDGGGLNQAGEDGQGSGGGKGGIAYAAGTLPATGGIFGSTANINPPNGADSRAPIPLGGRALPCPRGNQSVSPCTDLGQTKFLWGQVTPISNTAIIDRGFKQGYGIRQTAGAGYGGGAGGAGATGGNGGTNGGGGGGGSGYSDGSVTILDSGQGRSQYSCGTVKIRLYEPAVTTTTTTTPCVVVSVSSTYGTGFQGYLLYGNLSQESVLNGSNKFITTLKPEYAINVATTTTGFSATYSALAQTIINYYTNTIRRYPDDIGFDFWIDSFSRSSYSSLAELENAIDYSYRIQPGNERDYQLARGGLLGNYDNCNNKRL